MTVDAPSRPGYASLVAGGAPTPTSPPGDLLDRIDGGIAKAEGGLLVVIIGLMVGLSALQLFLRKFFDFGFEWADILVRQMVLWVGFVGGALATHQSRHIAIDAVNKFLAPRRAAVLRAITSLIAAGVAGVMVSAAWAYLKDEIEAESTIFGDFPAWPMQAVVPVVLALITFHFIVGARNNVLIALGKRQSPEELAEHTGEHPALGAE